MILILIGLVVFSVIIRYLTDFGFRIVPLETVFTAGFIFYAIVKGILILIAVWCFDRYFELPPRPNLASFLKFVMLPWSILMMTYYFYSFGLSGGLPDMQFFAQRIGTLVIFGVIYFSNYAETEVQSEEIA